MKALEGVSVLGILVGFVMTVASTIAFSLFSIAIFANLIEGGSDDVLMTSTGPLLYALAVLALSVVLGVWVCSRVSKLFSVVNSLGVVAVYGTFSYLLSQSPSNLDNPYPMWFVVSSYVILVPSAALGHFLSARRERVK